MEKEHGENSSNISVLVVVSQDGNGLMKESELIHLISNDVCDDAAVKAVKTAEQVGEEAKNSFMDMLQNNRYLCNDSISLNRLHVFHNSQTRGK